MANYVCFTDAIYNKCNELESKGKSDKAIKTYIKRAFHRNDESNLWPVCGKFNATHRAICRVSRQEKESDILYGFEYILALDSEISRIVNSKG